MFSFNNPFGACPKCTGLGTFMKIDPDLVIPNQNALHPAGRHQGQRLVLCDEGGIAQMYYEGAGRALRLFAGHPGQRSAQEGSWMSSSTAPRAEKLTICRETGSMAGGTTAPILRAIVNNLERRFRETSSDWMREEIAELDEQRRPAPTAMANA